MEEVSNHNPNFLFEEGDEVNSQEDELELELPSPVPQQQAPSPLITKQPLTFELPDE